MLRFKLRSLFHISLLPRFCTYICCIYPAALCCLSQTHTHTRYVCKWDVSCIPNMCIYVHVHISFTFLLHAFCSINFIRYSVCTPGLPFQVLTSHTYTHKPKPTLFNSAYTVNISHLYVNKCAFLNVLDLWNLRMPFIIRVLGNADITAQNSMLRYRCL